jgi:hypothetical protein
MEGMENHVIETADGIELDTPQPVTVDATLPQRSSLPPVQPPRKLPVMGVPSEREMKLVSSEATRFRSRSKYRGWA